MLYDLKWEKPDLELEGVSLRAFIAWLETKPANEAYQYRNPFQCALAQYLQSTGVPEPDSAVDLGVVQEPGSPQFLFERILNQRPTTFGAALQRARAACR